LAEISETTIRFIVFYIVFLMFTLAIVSMADVSLIKGVTQEQLNSLQGADALTLVTKFMLLTTLSSDFQIVAGLLLVLSIIMSYILIKEGRDLFFG
jgi:hypothetical protein